MKTFGKFIIYVSTTLLLFFVVDYLSGKVFDKLLFGVPLCDSQIANINYAERTLDSCNVLILGSSKANHNYDAGMLGDSLGMNVFNAGMDGMGVTYYAAILNAICSRTTPDVVILDLTYGDFSGKKTSRITTLRPYYPYDAYVADMTYKACGKAEQVLCSSAMYRYNSLLVRILPARLKSADTGINGYQPLPIDDSANRLELVAAKDEYQVDSVEYNAFADMVALSKSKGFDLMVVFSPEYALHSPSATAVELCRSLGVEPSVYTDVDKYLVNKHIYKDILHMNRLGAAMFTEDIIREIKTNNIIE